MAYFLSATKLQTYDRCPQAYYFRYERGVKDAAAFGSAALGQALHQALALFYGDWHYQEPLPDRHWLAQCWEASDDRLSPPQIHEGWAMLERYYQTHIQPLSVLKRPVAVEGKIQGTLQVENIEFTLTGRYDRLDRLDTGLELIDYKSGKDAKPPDPMTLDLQLGLYYLALQQHYGQSLQQLTLIYLRTGERLSYAATPQHEAQVRDLIGHLALELRRDESWQPQTGSHCESCAYRQYCAAISPAPLPLPGGSPPPQLQLALSL